MGPDPTSKSFRSSGHQGGSTTLSNCDLINLYSLVKSFGLERRLAELETSFLENSLTDVIDGRGISVFIKGERVNEA